MSLAQTVSCLDGYDPDALRVDKAREAIRSCLSPITQSETVSVKDALARVLAQDIVPQIDVPAHDNSAMDGYAVRFSDLGKGPLRQIGTALAGKPFDGRVGEMQCVRIMTGAVLPQGADTVVIQEIVKKEGDRILVPPGQKKAQNVRYAGEDLKIGTPVLRSGRSLKPADIGLIASLGIPMGSQAWHSARTAIPFSLGHGTGRCGCGMCPHPRNCAASPGIPMG